MDISAIGVKLTDFVKKYRYVVLILVIGIVLMSIPGKKTDEGSVMETTDSAAVFVDPTQELTQILTQIRGAGKVKLMLTMHSGQKTVYQTDQNSNSADETASVRLETVIVSGSDRTEQGLIQQVIAPEYRGAIVVCQGADDAAVRLAIVDAVADATGLGADRISVLKMK